MAEYPNLELIEYIFKQKAHEQFPDLLQGVRFPKFTADVFLQTWPNTATGFDKPGTVSGQAFTEAYTTVMKMTWYVRNEDGKYHINESDPIYAVFFGNRPAYVVFRPTEQFFKDLNRKNMASVMDSKRVY